MQGSILISPDQLVRRSSQGTNPSLNGKLHHQNSFNEHEFFVDVTSLNKIGEGRIQDLTGDILFPMIFKCAILIVIKKDPRPYRCIMFNNVLMCIENRADLPRLWIEVLTPQVVANRTNWSFHVYLNEHGKDTGTSTNDMAITLRANPTILPHHVLSVEWIHPMTQNFGGKSPPHI